MLVTCCLAARCVEHHADKTCQSGRRAAARLSLPSTGYERERHESICSLSRLAARGTLSMRGHEDSELAQERVMPSVELCPLSCQLLCSGMLAYSEQP